MKHSVFVLLTCSFAFGSALAAPPYHPPAHAPARPPVVVRPPTLPSQIILEQRRARDMVERRREEEDQTSWIDALHLTDKPFRGYDNIHVFFEDIKPPIVGLDDETREDAKERVLSDLENLDLPPNRKESIRREIEQRFQSDADASDKYQRRWLENVVGRFIAITSNIEQASQGDIARAVGEAITSANETLLKELNVFTGHGYSNFGVSLDLTIDRSVNENAAMANVNTVIQAMRGEIGGGSSPKTQIASVATTSVAPVPVPETSAVEAPAPPVAPENSKPIAINTPTLRETVAPSPRVGTENTQPLASSRPTVRETVVLTPPETPTYDILTPVPAYTPTDSHSTPTTTVPIRTASVPSSRERPSMTQINSSAVRSGPSFVGSVAALVGPAIKNGLVTVANWMDDHKLLGRDYEREGHSDFHGIGTGAFEGRLGYSMTPTSVVKGGIVRGSNIGGGLVL